MRLLLQVTRPGAIDYSAVNMSEDQAIIGKARKKVWVLTVVGYCALFILWPCLMAPAGGTWSIGYFRWELLHLTALPHPQLASVLARRYREVPVCVVAVKFNLSPAYQEYMLNSQSASLYSTKCECNEVFLGGAEGCAGPQGVLRR